MFPSEVAAADERLARRDHGLGWRRQVRASAHIPAAPMAVKARRGFIRAVVQCRRALLGLLAAMVLLSATAGHANPVAVRTGVHPGYERLVLEAQAAANLPVHVAETQVTIGPKIDVRAEGLARIQRLRSVETAVVEAGVLVIRLSSGASPRIERLQPNRLVLDFTSERRRTAPQPGTEKPPAQQPDRRPTAAATREPPRVSDRDPIAQVGTVSDASPAATPTRAASAPGPAREGLNRDQRSQPTLDAPEQQAQEHTPADHVGDRPPHTTAGQAELAVPAVQVPANSDAKLRGHVGVSAVEPPASPPAILFDWPAAVGAAAYARGGRIWIVFDHVPESFLLDRPGLARLTHHGLRRIRTYTRSDASLVELLLDGSQVITIQAEGQRWRVVIGPPAASPPASLLRVERGELRLEGVRQLLRVADPVVGDTVMVATASTALPAARDGRSLVDLTVLPSFQGLAWIARSDDLRSSLDHDRLRISRAGGLRLSQDVFVSAGADALPHAREQGAQLPEEPSELETGASSRAAAEGEPDPQEAGTDKPVAGVTAALDPVEAPSSADQRQDPEPLAPATEAATPANAAHRAPVEGLPPWETRSGLTELAPLDVISRRQLEQEVAATLAGVQEVEAVPLALELARLRLAEAFARESLVALQLAPDTASVDTRLAERRAFLAAAALALSGEHEAAGRLLQGPEFAEEPEADAWLGWLAAQRGDWETAAARLERQARLFEAYPQPLRVRFMLAALTAALQTGNPDRAYVWLERLAAENLGPPLADRVRFLEAMTLARDGAQEEARQLLAQLAHSDTWDIAAESVYAEIDLARTFGHMGPEEELATLLRERFLWRGHPLEPRVLRRIGRVQAETGDVAEALASWREALDRYPDDASVKGLQDEMRALFVAALDPATPPNPQPITMLRIFREFPELQPPPPAGRVLARHLAESLAAIGLAEPARALVRAHSDPEEPADVLLEAELALAAGQAEEALRLIESSSNREPSDRARLLRAQALLQLERAQEALIALGESAGTAAVRLRADAAWQAGRIDLLAALAEPLVAMAAETGDRFDRLRAARALAALAQIDPQQARTLMASAAANLDPALLAAVRLWLPEAPLPVAPRDVAAVARAWVAAARSELAALEGPLRAASLPATSAVR